MAKFSPGPGYALVHTSPLTFYLPNSDQHKTYPIMCQSLYVVVFPVIDQNVMPPNDYNALQVPDSCHLPTSSLLISLYTRGLQEPTKPYALEIGSDGWLPAVFGWFVSKLTGLLHQYGKQREPYM